MKNLMFPTFLFLVLSFMFPAKLAAHCEIPCGIYDDEVRITLILEDITTIEKSMQQIIALEKNQPSEMNQLVRWITNKEEHANKLQEIVTQYFMTQRIKFDAPDYDKKLASLHQLLVYSMKCKQTTDLENITKLRAAVETFKQLYFAKKEDHK